ncbi:PREDICTED: uncharacterized protein LOC108567100 [Nicrophorus vespilloides]|uniref:Uncharacterized protein LOC108567100 n=1 Tax=Nicrophorus vespilloides TaxID=110193 RepID=A0ABM1N7Q1_NICVS|nr:PREDICTED: uncharacterized protein LOC108567100 [Nicrophorus vespilloides]
MDKVLKRVGLSKRTIADGSAPKDNDDPAKGRRRRRSKSRRRATHKPISTTTTVAVAASSKKTRGLFNIDWDSVRDCKSCKSRALTKRFCNKKCDNELYRSNSFKFERFVRGGDEVSTLEKKISVCDEYSLPVDHLSKKRPNSIAVPSLSDWNVSSPNEEKVLEYRSEADLNVEILETYSTPRDSRQQFSEEEADQKCLTSPDREYSQPYTTDGSSEPSSDEEFFRHQVTVSQTPLELNSPDSIAEAILPLVNVQSPIRADIKRHPSPYYYSDLYKPRASLESPSKPTTSKYCENVRSEHNPGKPTFDRQGSEERKKSNQKSWSSYHKKYRKSLDSQSEKSNRPRGKYQLAHDRYRKSDAGIIQEQADRLNIESPCACVDGDDALEDEMSRQRHVYETAFDCRISKSDDDLDEIEKVTNHPVLVEFGSARDHESRRKVASQYSSKSNIEDVPVLTALAQKLETMHLPTEGASLPLRGYTPSPPSTAPLPTKFHGKESIMNSIRSAPNLPSHSKARLKNLHLPIKSLRGCSPTSSSSTFDIQLPHQIQDSSLTKDNRVLEIKDRPRKDLLLFKRAKNGKGTILEFKSRRRRHKYSSTESMTTSSSGGSMESIKSSTSEGNRSTTSTESRNSSSLSSHDSDSGAANNFLVAQSTVFHGQNKLHILSPISDKSSQEPVSEMSDNNRNNNSQKCSPEEVVMIETSKPRRRLPQNKNLLNLGFHSGDPEIQGSDSGISIQSREGHKSRFAIGEISVPTQTDFSDLPFDMPKLRRRRIMAQEACTSGSATSIDFGDLPFDMPKLRRRLRIQQSTKETSVSQASSSQSVVDPDVQTLSFRPKLTLNLTDMGTQKKKPGLGLSLIGMGLNLNIKSPTKHELIDINLPLEKQGWFHGAITRVEAENVLRLLREGSFLVRNSESTKQDYSLSLKSARGFMHMRIQRDDTDGSNAFILGQFSKPFGSIPEMIRHFSLNGLPIRGAEHMCLIQPVIAQLL